MRPCARAPRRRHLHFAIARNFRAPWPAHFAFETRPAQNPRGPPPPPPCPRSRNSLPPSRCFAHRPLAALARQGREAEPPTCCFRLHIRSIASPVPWQFRPPRRRPAPALSAGLAARAGIPLASAVCESFPSRSTFVRITLVCSASTDLPCCWRVLVNARSVLLRYRMCSSAGEICCSLLLDIVI